MVASECIFNISTQRARKKKYIFVLLHEKKEEMREKQRRFFELRLGKRLADYNSLKRFSLLIIFFFDHHFCTLKISSDGKIFSFLLKNIFFLVPKSTFLRIIFFSLILSLHFILLFLKQHTSVAVK